MLTRHEASVTPSPSPAGPAPCPCAQLCPCTVHVSAGEDERCLCAAWGTPAALEAASDPEGLMAPVLV